MPLSWAAARASARVVEGGECFRFTPKGLEGVGARGHLSRRHLERHVAAELRVGGAVDLAHPAGADRGGDAVVGEAAADHEGRRIQAPRTSSPKERPARARSRSCVAMTIGWCI